MSVVCAGLAVVGLLVVAVLVLCRADLRRAARTGPRWKRRLVAAGLLLLASIGLSLGDEPPKGQASARPTSAPAAPDAVRAGAKLAETRPWQRVAATWAEVEAVACGRQGRLPFDRAGRRRLLANAADATRDITALRAAGVLTKAEAELLRIELDVLVAEARAFPAHEERRTEYDYIGHVKMRLARSGQFTRGLAALPKAKALHKFVAERAQAGARELLADLNVPPAKVSVKDLARLRAAAAKVRAAAQRLRPIPTIDDTRLVGSPTGQAVQTALKMASLWLQVEESGGFWDSEKEFISHESVLAALTQAIKVVVAQPGSLRKAEVEFLAADLRCLTDKIRYTMGMIRVRPPADGTGEGTRRHEAADPVWPAASRLELLGKLAAAGPIHEPILDLVETGLRAEGSAYAPWGSRAGEVDRGKTERTKVAAALAKLRRLPKTNSARLIAGRAWQEIVLASGRTDDGQAGRRVGKLWVVSDSGAGPIEPTALYEHVAALRRAGLIRPIEADVLWKELWLQANRGRGEGTTFATVQRLTRRLPLLEPLVRARAVRREVLDRILPSIEGDMSLHNWGGGWTYADDAAAHRLRKRVLQAVAKIRDRVPIESRDLAKTHEWRRITAAWHKAYEIGTYQRGGFPFTPLGEVRALGEMEGAIADVGRLEKAGLLSAAEAQLLRIDLKMLARSVARRSNRDSYEAMCYAHGPPGFLPYDEEKRVQARLRLLDKLGAAERLKPRVLAKVLYTVQLEAPRVDKHAISYVFSSRRERREAKRLVRQIHKRVARIRSRIRRADVTLEDNPDWAVIVEAWKLARPLSKAPGKTADRARADARLTDAVAASMRLEATGLLRPREGQYLRWHAAWLRVRMFRRRPTDHPTEIYEDPNDSGRYHLLPIADLPPVEGGPPGSPVGLRPVVWKLLGYVAEPKYKAEPGLF